MPIAALSKCKDKGAHTALCMAMCIALMSCGGGGGSAPAAAPPTSNQPPPPEPEPEPEPMVFENEVALGESLFNDTNLSANRTVACATCHNPGQAFTDNRLNANGDVSAVSLGDDGFSLGDRNAPTGTYASITPEFTFARRARFNSQQPDYEGYIGGFFLDGRADTLAEQAKGPPLNPSEMGMPDTLAVAERIGENLDYVATFESFFGENIFDDADAVFDAMANSIAAFERTTEFSTFDSRYDKSLRGEFEYNPLSKAARGRSLFFSQQFTNCATCHQLRPQGNDQETFSGYEYHNIGVPVNENVRALNGIAPDFVDPGLAQNPLVPVTEQNAELGKYKTPTLRNVAVTPPYMHNGVFRELATVIMFYDQFFQGSAFPTNPETGAAWRDPLHTENLALTELLDGRRMTVDDVEAMVCFLRTLTDERFEPLIEENGIVCD
ncbi:MAG: cytochrome c peroxidase [Pseudomonadota bacterium]